MTPRIITTTLNPAIDVTASIPNFTPNAVNRVLWEQADPGGKGVNVASFLADFNPEVSVTGWLGEENPELFQKFFAQKGIVDRFLRIPGRTRTNIKVMDEAQQQVTDINFPGHQVTDQEVEQLVQAIADLASEQDWFVLSGQVPRGAPATIYHNLIGMLKEQGKTVVLDASGESLQKALSAQPDLIKPNIHELQELLGRSLETEAEITQAAQDLVQQGIGCVVVSMGARGAIFVNAQETLLARPPQIEIKSTVGAGDAMVAGMVTGMARALPLQDCARLATAFSMGTLSLIGPRLPPPEVVESLTDRVSVQELS